MARDPDVLIVGAGPSGAVAVMSKSAATGRAFE